MGQLFGGLSPRHVAFIEAQKIFFVGTAAGEGTVNVSPKGGDSLRVLDANTLAWLNLTGSGNESAAHVLHNPRMTVMFCAFEGVPLILRAYGRARVLHRGGRRLGGSAGTLSPKRRGSPDLPAGH
nr:pyridoxamine 5'-phosphate oxidase family protein [Aeromonas sanarellii]